VNAQFSKQLSIRAIVDYYGLAPNTSLIQETLTRRVSGDVLATYLINPFTALYVGYAEGYQNLALDPTTPPQIRVIDSASRLAVRQVFVKLSYLLGL
jgi:hypothetical protein